MELLLIRHGTAEPHGHPGGDRERALVEKGREQAACAGLFLAKIERLPDMILTSPVLRALQTAEVFCKVTGLDSPIVQPWLACGMQPETATRELTAYTEFERVAIFGHEPDFSELAGHLLGATKGRVRMKKGAIACIRLHPPLRHAELQFLLPPKAMR